MEFIETIKSNREKFLKFNEIKFNRFQQLITNVNTRRVINSIPFLFCVNHKKLPGFINGDIPLGIANYTVDEETKKFIRGKFPTAKVEIDTGPPFIEMLAIMGSIGTIAYNKKSDFDYWVCINKKDITDKQFENFRIKVDAIQKWASAEIKLPVHIFINDVDYIKQNIFAEDEEEAFGSTVGAVLKDEFFRSSIILSGKTPFWWVVPKFVNDTEYNNLYTRLQDDEIVQNFVDLGNLYEISREDFLGAALFQIIKSLGNPFKSIIKIGVLEKYLTDTSESPLLSQKVKTNMLRENLDNTILDGYLMMFKEVYDYYSSKHEDDDLLDILKKNLYLKTDPQISKYLGIKDKKNIPYKVEVMFKYVKEWGWDIKKITELDNFDNWDFNMIMEFWDSVRRFMLLCYQRISVQLPALSAGKKIPESDILLLSRKIKTHFRREQDKIDQFISFKDTPSEAALYLEPVTQDIHDVDWRLYKRDTSGKDKLKTTTLKTEKSLLKLIIWASLNRIYDPVSSRFNLQSGYSRINQPQIINLLNQTSEFFRFDKINIRNDYFLNPEFNLLNFIIINFDTEKAEEITNLYFLYHTSWGESFLKEYKSEEDLAEILHTVLRDGLKQKKSFENYCALNTPDPYKKIYKSIINLFKEAYTALIENTNTDSARFITHIGNKFIVFTRNGDTLEKNEFPNIFNLLATVTLKPKKQIEYKFPSNDAALSSLDAVFNISKNHPITIAYEEKGDFIITYIINENGNLFTFFKPKISKNDFLSDLFNFCQNIIKRVKKMDVFSSIDKGDICVQYFKTDRFGKLSTSDDTHTIKGQSVLKYENTNALTASVIKHKNNEPFYNIIFPDKASSGFIPIKDFGKLSKKILELRNSGIQVNNTIKDLVFSDLKKEEITLGSTLYFLEKYRIESILEKITKKS